MITLEQLKDAEERTAALKRYLDIDSKRIEVEEEELRTHVADFWDDRDKAEAQMRKIKELHFWIDSYTALEKQVEELQLAFDFVKEELVTEQEVDQQYEAVVKELERLELRNMLRREEDKLGVVLKINSGAGGTESQDWAQMLMRLYLRYAERHGLKVELMSESPNEAGGMKEVIVRLTGEKPYGQLKFEGGVHRVQRVPVTESQGRIHTSTATVAVLPEAEETDLEIKPEDLRIDIYRSGGHGGQGVNTTDSAVRITHLPTGLVVAMQDERSQQQNRVKAMTVLRSRLIERQKQEEMKAASNARKSLIGSGDRSEKIRTYNFPQGRVTDHRIGLTLHKLDSILQGFLDEIIEALITTDQAEKLKAVE